MARCYEPAPPIPLRTRFSLTCARHMKPVADFSLDMFKFTAFPQIVYTDYKATTPSQCQQYLSGALAETLDESDLVIADDKAVL